jgi:hypothetical protein
MVVRLFVREEEKKMKMYQYGTTKCDTYNNAICLD